MPVTESRLRDALLFGHTLDVLPADFDQLGERYSGKVRENFSSGDQRIIIVSDRISAFDVVLGTIPFKGQILNGLARYWFEATADLAANHMIATPDPQAMRVHECTPVPVEFVVRAYLTGVSSTSIWRAYESGERVFCGHKLAENMVVHQRLPAPIVTPSTKAAKGGHDRSVSRSWLIGQGIIEADSYDRIAELSLALFARGQKIAAERGLLLVDTKYEFGIDSAGELRLIDEIHTPDSSRYWYADTYEEAMAKGEDPRSLDKEFVRRWLVSEGFRGEGRPPILPDQIRMAAAQRYIETAERLTGMPFEPSTLAPLPRLRENLGVRSAGDGRPEGR
ncbi:MAG TPA: phosphoribosylaminoimidazolesuccinocarboxamide synthase [Nannocystis exedens]|nr:phosphoribosylaminoimidazolesuccinocarboxamide synthase [Nannocystis exedens]